MNIRHGILSTIFYMDAMPTNLCMLLWHTLFALALYSFLLAVTVTTWLTLLAGFITTGVFLVNHPLAVVTIVQSTAVLLVCAIALLAITVEYLKMRWNTRRHTNIQYDAAGYVTYPDPHTVTVLYRAFKDKYCPVIEWREDD